MDVSALGDSTQIMEYLVQHARCLVNDGKIYGASGAGYLRISYGCVKKDEDLFDAVDRMAKALGELSRQKSIAE